MACLRRLFDDSCVLDDGASVRRAMEGDAPQAEIAGATLGADVVRGLGSVLPVA
jgi:hypothetical protein